MCNNPCPSLLKQLPNHSLKGEGRGVETAGEWIERHSRQRHSDGREDTGAETGDGDGGVGDDDDRRGMLRRITTLPGSN